MTELPRPGKGPVPRVRGTQLGLRDPDLVDHLKGAMLGGRYFYEEPRGQIGGVRDRRGIYHVVDGHHRMVAALEVVNETGDPTAVLQLLQWGRWTEVEFPPFDSRPLPARNWWGALRNWLGV